MKLLTAVVAPNRSQRVTAALDDAGFMTTTVATAQASGLSGSTLRYKGVEHRDQRCVRIEVLVGDADLEAATALITTSVDAPQDVIVWACAIDDISRQSLSRVAV